MSDNDTILVVAPHPDDETLGCGGTLLRYIQGGAQAHWLIVTGIDEAGGFTPEQVTTRGGEIEAVARRYGFTQTHALGLPTTRLDTLPQGDIVGKISRVFRQVQPHTVYVPYPGDAHSDHRVVFEAATACTKWFRYPSVRRVLAYETLSETDFGLSPDINGFRPNVFVDISAHLDEKIAILNVFPSEVGAFPFPRSETAVRALAQLRGAACGCKAAEAFLLLREIL